MSLAQWCVPSAPWASSDVLVAAAAHARKACSKRAKAARAATSARLGALRRLPQQPVACARAATHARRELARASAAPLVHTHRRRVVTASAFPALLGRLVSVPCAQTYEASSQMARRRVLRARLAQRGAGAASARATHSAVVSAAQGGGGACGKKVRSARARARLDAFLGAARTPRGAQENA